LLAPLGSFCLIIFIVSGSYRPDDADYSMRWLLLKRHFTRAMIKQDKVKAGNRYGEYAVWQRRFWEHAIRHERDLENHFTYIRGNAVRHGLVQSIEDWPHSSFYERTL
jgi:putative transposase